MSVRAALPASLLSVPLFFALRVGSALLLLKLSASHLPVEGFTIFSQFLLFGALLNTIAVAGAQNGLVRLVAAAPGPAEAARAQGAALAIWIGVIPLVALPTILAAGAIANLLVDSPAQFPAVIAIALLSLAAGPGQIWCAILSGHRRTAASMTAQALGLALGTLLASWLILRGEAAPAAIGFAAGPLATLVAAFAFSAPVRAATMTLRTIAGDIRELLRYSAAFVATSAFTALTLFALRSVYREAFGAEALGYWIVANRISDTSTQLLGLFMVQVFVPHFAAAADDKTRRAILLRCWAVAAAVMTGFLLIFSLAPELLVRLLLSDAYLPAIDAIRLYMAGDVLRVWASLAMFAFFARGKPGLYAGTEIATYVVLAALTLALVGLGDARAPMLGYAGAYALVAAIVTAAFVLRRPSRAS